MFIGEELEGILRAIETDTPYGGREKELLKIGVHILPKFPRDSTDRNRTSPFAFTGNRFEFRMPGSNLSISGPNVVLNTIVAEELSQFADLLEPSDDFQTSLDELIKKTIREHKRILFNGNGYDSAWLREAESRGLLNLKSTPECLPYLLHEKNVAVFEKQKVLTRTELESRYEILLTGYCKVINIEALTMQRRDCYHRLIFSVVVGNTAGISLFLADVIFIGSRRIVGNIIEFYCAAGIGCRLEHLSAAVFENKIVLAAAFRGAVVYLKIRAQGRSGLTVCLVTECAQFDVPCDAGNNCYPCPGQQDN